MAKWVKLEAPVTACDSFQFNDTRISRSRFVFFLFAGFLAIIVNWAIMTTFGPDRRKSLDFAFQRPQMSKNGT